MTNGDRKKVTIVGGGLAGIAAARCLLNANCRVTLVEASGRLGGKAGASLHDARPEEHGYHIFPLWYSNIWRLVKDLEIDKHFLDCTDFLQLSPNEFPKYRTLRNVADLRSLWANLTSGVMSFPQMFLFFYATLDLMSQSFSYRSLLDQISVDGFIRYRFYRTEQVATQFQDMVLKGISVPCYFVSAMTVRQVMRYWAANPAPMCRILKGNLQDCFIAPLEKELTKLGCRIYKNCRLDGIELCDNLVRAIRITDLERNACRKEEVDELILAIPHEAVATVIDDNLYTAAPPIASVQSLQSQPMAALTLYFKERIPGLRGSHTNLLDSKFGLSFIDVGQNWPDQDRTVLNLIASDAAALASLSSEAATREIIKELRRYVPFEDHQVASAYLQKHLDAPLFMNDVGAWHFRPDPLDQPLPIANLHLAGDFCRSHVDLVCMEGAYVTGLRAAASVCRRLALEEPRIEMPAVHPRRLLVVFKLLLLPFAVLAKWAVCLSDADQTRAAASGSGRL